jgi:hypothetical protein
VALALMIYELVYQHTYREGAHAPEGGTAAPAVPAIGPLGGSHQGRHRWTWCPPSSRGRPLPAAGAPCSRLTGLRADIVASPTPAWRCLRLAGGSALGAGDGRGRKRARESSQSATASPPDESALDSSADTGASTDANTDSVEYTETTADPSVDASVSHGDGGDADEGADDEKESGPQSCSDAKDNAPGHQKCPAGNRCSAGTHCAFELVTRYLSPSCPSCLAVLPRCRNLSKLRRRCSRERIMLRQGGERCDRSKKSSCGRSHGQLPWGKPHSVRLKFVLLSPAVPLLPLATLHKTYMCSLTSYGTHAHRPDNLLYVSMALMYV